MAHSEVGKQNGSSEALTVTLHGKGDPENVIGTLRWGDDLGLPEWVHLIT